MSRCWLTNSEKIVISKCNSDPTQIFLKNLIHASTNKLITLKRRKYSSIITHKRILENKTLQSLSKIPIPIKMSLASREENYHRKMKRKSIFTNYSEVENGNEDIPSELSETNYDTCEDANINEILKSCEFNENEEDIEKEQYTPYIKSENKTKPLFECGKKLNENSYKNVDTEFEKNKYFDFSDKNNLNNKPEEKQTHLKTEHDSSPVNIKNIFNNNSTECQTIYQNYDFIPTNDKVSCAENFSEYVQNSNHELYKIQTINTEDAEICKEFNLIRERLQMSGKTNNLIDKTDTHQLLKSAVDELKKMSNDNKPKCILKEENQIKKNKIKLNLYNFNLPPDLSEHVKVKCPPFSLLLDHTIAVIWRLFSEKHTPKKPISKFYDNSLTAFQNN